MQDMFSYGYLGFALGPDARTLYYLTGAHLPQKSVARETNKGESRGEEDLHLVTYDVEAGVYEDRGRIILEDGRVPSYVNSLAISPIDGSVFALTRVGPERPERRHIHPQSAHPVSDLMMISAAQLRI